MNRSFQLACHYMIRFQSEKTRPWNQRNWLSFLWSQKGLLIIPSEMFCQKGWSLSWRQRSGSSDQDEHQQRRTRMTAATYKNVINRLTPLQYFHTCAKREKRKKWFLISAVKERWLAGLKLMWRHKSGSSDVLKGG